MFPIQITPDSSASVPHFGLGHEKQMCEAAPLDSLTLFGTRGYSVNVIDSKGRVYWSGSGGVTTSFVVGGALGVQRAEIVDSSGHTVAKVPFRVQAKTEIKDEHGEFKDLLEILHRSMLVYGGVEYATYKGKEYHYYVPWNLDQNMTSKGMRYFDGTSHEFVDLHRLGQREDGMIYSNTALDTGPGYFDTAYGQLGLVKHDGGLRWTRQSVEAMPEFYYVLNMYGAWIDKGDTNWLRETVDSGCRALDYVIADKRLRWSTKYDLIKRAYTIDMWDFQATDKYLPDAFVSPSMVIDPDRTKFGIFYGDNTGYAYACQCLGEMLDAAGRPSDALKYRTRGKEVLDRTNRLLWNGHFYTHRQEEDPAVVRDFGVDEKTQVTLSNAFSINRGIGHEKSVEIIRTYQRIRKDMPEGSPGEWYMCYPPFQRGFGAHSDIWEYMNGGVGATVAGELAKGAFENGFEAYGTDILRRIRSLGKSHKGLVGWEWRGAPRPPYKAAVYQPIDLASVANMDIVDRSTDGAIGCLESDANRGNDLHTLPIGNQVYEVVPYEVVDPIRNSRKCAVAVTAHGRLPRTVEIPVGNTAKTVYLLQAVSRPGPSHLGAYIRFEYDDGSQVAVYETVGKEMAVWWFPELHTETSGVAWTGPNSKSAAVGTTWTAISNPNPDKVIRAIEYGAVEDGPIAALFALTLSDQPHPVPRSDLSFGGPDNWSAASCMFGLIEGLAGTEPLGAAFDVARVCPRWMSADVHKVSVTSVLPASNGYVSYQYEFNPAKKSIALWVTGSGREVHLHILLPSGLRGMPVVTVNGTYQSSQLSSVEGSRYVDLTIATHPSQVHLSW